MPSPLPFETPPVRRLIIASYWLVALVAACIWWSTTSIERLSLPESEVHALASRTLRLPVHISLSMEWPSESQAMFESELKRRLSPEGLDVYVLSASSSANTSSYQIGGHLDSRGYILNERTLSLPPSSEAGPVEVAKTVAELLSLYPKSFGKHLVVKHAPRYRLAFTLLNEDAAAGGAIVDWDIEELVSRHIAPTLERLSLLHNFTMESQVRYHAPLAFTPAPIESTSDRSYGLTPAELTVFINSAEWSLSSSVSDDPVLHLVAFVPSAERRPLRLLDASAQITPYNSFIIPQWGGIVIVNPETSQDEHSHGVELNAAFTTFRTQLSSLLGIHQLPSNIDDSVKDQPISDWQLDSLMRRRLLEITSATQETLSSIIKLVNQIENMPVGLDVKNDIQDSLDYMKYVFTHLNLPIEWVVARAIKASTLASRAFFNPGMLALLYFPVEHTYAVYTPLFVPIGIPLLASVIKELKRSRRT